MPKSSRREFLKMSGTVAGVGYLGVQWPVILSLGQVACTARDQQAAFDNIDAGLAADLAAIAAQIIPSDDKPGANEAGVIYFIDAALGSFMQGATDLIGDGVDELNEASSAAHPGKRFAELDFSSQTQLLKAIENGPFFGALKFMTVAGMFAMPRYGGNKDHAGWKLIDFDHHHSWQPPFGHYDTGAHGDE